jgi:putative transposase
MVRVASSVDNTLMESLWSTMQRELPDLQSWQSRGQFALVIFEWTEAFYTPVLRHASLGGLSPAKLEACHTAAQVAAR